MSSSILPSGKTVSVIMNAFKRPQNIGLQLDAVRSQTHQVSEIMLWINGTERELLPELEGVTVAHCSENLGVWARFAFALNAKSDFVWLIDDDTVPGPGWLACALEAFDKTPGIIGSRGLKFAGKESYLIYDEVGPNAMNETTEEVDIVGHNWIFPRAWLAAFWGEYHHAHRSEISGEDIHLSYAIKKNLGFGTFVPPHPPGKPEVWGELRGKSAFDGTDSAAISQQPKSLSKFEKAYRHYIKLGLMPLALSREEPASKRVSRRFIGSVASRLPGLVTRLARAFKIRK